MPVFPQAEEQTVSPASRIERAFTIAPLPIGPLTGFGFAILAVLLIALFSYQSLQARADTQALVAQTIEVREQLQMVLSALKDAETGQRGYLLTGIDAYLTPYTNAKASLPGELDNLRRLLRDDPEQLKRLEAISSLSADKMAELANTIELYGNRHTDDALSMVRSDRGKLTMDRLRALISEMTNHERDLLADR